MFQGMHFQFVCISQKIGKVANSFTLTTENNLSSKSSGGQRIETAQPVSSVYFPFNTLKMYPTSFKKDKVLIILTGQPRHEVEISGTRGSNSKYVLPYGEAPGVKGKGGVADQKCINKHFSSLLVHDHLIQFMNAQSLFKLKS